MAVRHKPRLTRQLERKVERSEEDGEEDPPAQHARDERARARDDLEVDS